MMNVKGDSLLLKEQKQSKLLMLLVCLLGTGMFYYSDGGTSLGSYTIMTKYLYGLLIVGVGFFSFLVTPDMDHIKRVGQDGLVLAMPTLILILFSMVLWILQKSPLSNMTRGFSDAIYQMIGLLIAAAYMVMFRGNAIYVQLASMLLANTFVIVLNNIRVAGLVNFIKEYISLLLSFGENSGETMVLAEVNDLTFAIGLYLLFFLVKKSNVKHRGMLIILAGLFFTVGLKRIAVVAIAVAVLFSVFSRVFSEENAVRYLRVMGAFFIIFAIVYIPFVKFGIYNRIAELWGINTMGRTDINDMIDAYYSFSPSFKGYGLGFISRLLESMKDASVGAIHNDYLRIYIETGFFGYLLWLWSIWGFGVNNFCKKRSYEMGMIYFAIFTYCFVTYLTDNTYFYFYTNVATFTLALSCEYEEITTGKELKT